MKNTKNIMYKKIVQKVGYLIIQCVFLESCPLSIT
jgi:hypothetical protein